MKKIIVLIGVLFIAGVALILSRNFAPGSQPKQASASKAASTLPQAELSPELEKIFEKGVAAAEQQSWDLAAKYFAEVQEVEPFYAPVYFNLALARANQGQELAAMAWLYAFLSANPRVQNRQAIEKELTKLEVAAEAKVQTLFERAIETAKVLPTSKWVENQYVSGGKLEINPQKDGLQSVFYSQARAGDVEGALRTGTMIAKGELNSYYQSRSYVQRLYAEELAGEGNVGKAVEIAKELPVDERDAVFHKAAASYVEDQKYLQAYQVMKIRSQPPEKEANLLWMDILIGGGNIEEALNIIEQWPESARRLEAWNRIIAHYREKGKEDQAGAVMEKALQFGRRKSQETGRFPNGYDYPSPLLDLAKYQIQLGELKEAEATLDLWQGAHLKDFAYIELGPAYARQGNLAKAEEFAQECVEDYHRIWAYSGIGNVFVEKGDWQNAAYFLTKITQDNVFSPYAYPSSFAVRMWIEIREGRPERAEQILQEAPSDKRGSVKTVLAQYAARDGNYEKAKEIALGFGNAADRGDTLVRIVDIQTDRGDFNQAYRLMEENLNELLQSTSWSIQYFVKRLMEKHQPERGVAILKRAEPMFYDKGNAATFKDLIALYEQFGYGEGAERIRSLQETLTWMDMGKNAFNRDPGEFEAELQSLAGSKPEEVPSKIDYRAGELAKGLRQIQRTRKEL